MFQAVILQHLGLLYEPQSFFNKEIIENKLAGLERTNGVSPGWLGIINVFLTRV